MTVGYYYDHCDYDYRYDDYDYDDDCDDDCDFFYKEELNSQKMCSSKRIVKNIN